MRRLGTGIADYSRIALSRGIYARWERPATDTLLAGKPLRINDILALLV